MKTIQLNGKKELDIYINPQRQRLLRTMTLLNRPATPKQLSAALGISASSVQYHLRKLAELGIVEQSHTESINGITAHYYHVPPQTISIGSNRRDENEPQRLALMRSGVTGVFDGFTDYVQNAPLPEPGAPVGDLLWGIARLQPAEARQLMGMVRAFLEEHQLAGQAGDSWEYALIAYPVVGGDHA